MVTSVESRFVPVSSNIKSGENEVHQFGGSTSSMWGAFALSELPLGLDDEKHEAVLSARKASVSRDRRLARLGRNGFTVGSKKKREQVCLFPHSVRS